MAKKEEEKRRKKGSVRLVWDSKPRRTPNPKDIDFQTAEVVIPNPHVHVKDPWLPLSFRDGLFGEKEIDKQKMNRLIWGDNLLAMQALLAHGYEGKIDLIYIDPPFDSKADYSHKIFVEGDEFTKEPSIIERLAYTDTWAGGTDSYLDMLYPRLQLMRLLLADTGSIYVHCDWHVGHHVKVALDEVFGQEQFQNHITWYYPNKIPDKRKPIFTNAADFIFYYAKKDGKQKFNVQYESVTPHRRAREVKKNGVKQTLRDEGGNVIYQVYDKRMVDSVWRIPSLAGSSSERTEYDTQKPIQLLERIVMATTNQGDLVSDFFAGSGTTLAVAEKLGRRWIGCELGKVGIQVTRGRLVEQGAKPFLIENIGNYQREMIYLTGGRIWEMQHLILKLYGATPRDKKSGLGIRRADDGVEELVYVSEPDRPIAAKKAEELALRAGKLDGRGYKRLVLLGWDYEYNYSSALESRLKAQKDLKVQIESRDIPPDIYDYLKRAKSDEDVEALSSKVRFYERPYLRLEAPEIDKQDNEKVRITVGIKRYVLMDIPVEHFSKKGAQNRERLLEIAKDNFAILIDYWAVDWDYDGFTFKSQWQAFRGNGKKAKTVPVTALETLDAKKRTIAVRVVDIFGNDAAATIEIEGR